MFVFIKKGLIVIYDDDELSLSFSLFLAGYLEIHFQVFSVIVRNGMIIIDRMGIESLLFQKSTSQRK